MNVNVGKGSASLGCFYFGNCLTVFTNQKLIDKQGEKEYEGTSLKMVQFETSSSEVKVVFLSSQREKAAGEFVSRFLFALGP